MAATRAPAPVVLVTGIEPAAMAAVTIGLQWDLPRAVVVEHRIDVAASTLLRIVSDSSGVLERVETDLAHVCVSCAIREDVVPTLDRLAADGRWESVIAHLPVGAEALQVCRVAAYEPSADLRVAVVVAALDGPSVVEDLLGDALLAERGWHSSEEDVRGVGEVGAAMVEYADVVALCGQADDLEVDLVTALARPGALVVPDPGALEGSALVAGLRRHDRTEAWVAEVRRSPLPTVPSEHVWTLDLTSPRPMHPERLYEAIEAIGGGPRRSRGCFWLPSRPGVVCAWDGSGGQLSIGSAGAWGRSRPLTRIVVTGLDDDGPQIQADFERCLVTEAEMRVRGTLWEVAEDGFEPWLGHISRVA